MPREIESQIQIAEERLRRAMLTSDLETLDKLISPELLFTNHLGQVLGKQDDLALHRSGILKFHTLEPSESQMKISEKIAIVSIRMKISLRWRWAPRDGVSYAASISII